MSTAQPCPCGELPGCAGLIAFGSPACAAATNAACCSGLLYDDVTLFGRLTPSFAAALTALFHAFMVGGFRTIGLPRLSIAAFGVVIPDACSSAFF